MTRTHTHAYIHRYVSTYIHTYMHTNKHSLPPTNMLIHVYMYVYVYTYIHTCVYIYARIGMYTYWQTAYTLTTPLCICVISYSKSWIYALHFVSCFPLSSPFFARGVSFALFGSVADHTYREYAVASINDSQIWFVYYTCRCSDWVLVTSPCRALQSSR
jgi:hypothetical protein